jgi:anti-sigma factor RsiW
MSELDNILSDDHGRLPEDKLMAYLEGRLSPEEQHEVEAWLAEEGMESDALEGLQQLAPGDAKQSAARLNNELRKMITGKKERRKKQIRNTPWSWTAILVILLLAILAYMVLHLMLKK